jgi:hypothetical protein
MEGWQSDGEKIAGYFMDDEPIPNVCEDQGLVKGTPSFVSCVNRFRKTMEVLLD